MFFSYLKKLILFAAFIALVIVCLSFVKTFRPVITFAWVCYGVFLALSIITFYFSTKTITGKFGSFMNIFFVSIFSKLVITAVIILIYKQKVETADVNFIIPFAIIYFSFLFFETLELVKMSRKVGNNQKKKMP
ncbi:MAG: hypothetical protein ACHQFW_00655 [Chitinophagales bacterium]